MSLKDLFVGVGYVPRGLGLLFRPGLKRYAVMPVVASGGLFFLIGWFGRRLMSVFTGWLEGRVPDSIRAFADWFLWFLFAVLFGGAIIVTFVMVVGLVASPFLSNLAEAVLLKTTGEKLPSKSLLATLGDIPRSIGHEVKKILYFIFWALLILVLYFVPIVNIAAPFLWYGFCSFMLTLTSIDYIMDLEGFRFRDMRRVLKERMLLSLGFGFTAGLFATVPFVNILCLPATVAGATLMWIETMRAGAKRSR